MEIPNRYKNTLDNFIDSSNPESPLGPIGKEAHNAPRSRGSLTNFLEKDCLDENVLASDRSLQLAPKTGDS